MATSISRIFFKNLSFVFWSYFTCFVVRLNRWTDQLESRRWPDSCPNVSFTEFFSKSIFHEPFLWYFTSSRSFALICSLTGRLRSPDQSEATSTSLSWKVIGQRRWAHAGFEAALNYRPIRTAVKEPATQPCSLVDRRRGDASWLVSR